MSYQKGSGAGAGAQYQTIDDVTNRHKSCLKWSVAAVFLLAVGVAISLIGPPDNEEVIYKHMKDSSPVKVREDGSLALFDNLSTCKLSFAFS